MLQDKLGEKEIGKELLAICKKHGVIIPKQRKKKPKMKNMACQTNDKEHWEFIKATKTLKNKDELKRFMRGI